MMIQEVIDRIKKYHKGYGSINDAASRDQILFGDPDQICTGIVVCIWPSMHVIEEARRQKANLIISHEALFWNHGDHTGWLEAEQNQVYLKKKEQLLNGSICVWRNHDYIHSGIPLQDGSWTDGIFYGFARQLGWEEYLDCPENPMSFHLPDLSVKQICQHMTACFPASGMKIIGSPDLKVSHARILLHCLGKDNQTISMADKDDCNLYIAMELIDFTFAQYIRDAAEQGLPKAIVCMGHFNTEEPGMQYFDSLLDEILPERCPHSFVPAGDFYSYWTRVDE